ncbi:Transmembrane protein [Parasponia andersonii]|uniref:Transmembrane protein n=1 Tax=Parasponia andersonii TaxID=3476 RepID=A0A2P5AMV8_PARAD|nr:Transmembrane protein [Parasponia andersonii]
MADTQTGREEKVSAATAVLVGALAPGVNGTTWNTLKSAFVMLGLSLVVMLALSISSSDSSLVLHVSFLVIITLTLFLLLTWFLGQTGLVSIEHQMQDLHLVPIDASKINKKRE